MIEPSCTLLASPTLIGAISPRSTAPYQTLARAPSVTSPSTTAPGAMKALRWMLITPSWGSRGTARSEEHTSELQSRLHLVCRLLLEKKKKTNTQLPTAQ